jgi:hypothetical protein
MQLDWIGLNCNWTHGHTRAELNAHNWNKESKEKKLKKEQNAALKNDIMIMNVGGGEGNKGIKTIEKKDPPHWR